MRRAVMLTAIFILTATTFGARAASPSIATFADPNGSVTWSGTIAGPAIMPGDPSQCNALGYAAGACDRFTVDVELPAHYWATHHGSVEFAIHWDERDSTERDLDLFVEDPAGNVVARSTGQDSEAEIAFAHDLPNGLYDVYVVAVSSPDDDIAYDGLVDVEPDRALDAPGHGHDLLPDLVSLPTKTVMIATAQYLVDPVHNTVLSCYPEESVDSQKNGEDVATRCLRFDQIVEDAGEGPLTLRFNPADNPSAPSMYQVIDRSDGTSYERFAGTGEFHPVHAHWHYTGFGFAQLFDMHGNMVVQGKKRGFCLIDVEFPHFTMKGNDPRTTSFPGCQTPGADGNILEGIGRGWADNYNWFLADQYLDITNVPDGMYRLAVTANPNAFAPTDAAPGLLESDLSNNTSSVTICLAGLLAAIIDSPDGSCLF
ncbi:MAG: lysyl oxidase family protein [Actinomycetota bacterium]